MGCSLLLKGAEFDFVYYVGYKNDNKNDARSMLAYFPLTATQVGEMLEAPWSASELRRRTACSEKQVWVWHESPQHVRQRDGSCKLVAVVG